MRLTSIAVIGLFESFKVFLSGVAANTNTAETLLALTCAVLLLRCMYCKRALRPRA